MSEISAYPLTWPAFYPRTQLKRESPFSTSFAAARDGLRKELELFSCSNIIFSTNIPLKQNGEPYAKYSGLTDTGVAVYFTRRGESFVLACDFYIDIAANMQGIRKTVEALRGIARWGSLEILNRAFVGFKTLPAAAPPIEKKWFEVLGVSLDAQPEEITKVYKALVKKYHPQGTEPDEEKLRTIIEAYDKRRFINAAF